MANELDHILSKPISELTKQELEEHGLTILNVQLDYLLESIERVTYETRRFIEDLQKYKSIS